MKKWVIVAMLALFTEAVSAQQQLPPGGKEFKDGDTAFKKKDWNEIKSHDAWIIFKVMAEFVEGFEKMAKIGPSVTIFGSARTKADNKYFKMAEEIAGKLAQKGYGVITGGGVVNSFGELLMGWGSLFR